MKFKFSLLATALTAFCASADLPVKLLNNTDGKFADSDIYVAIIGKQGDNSIYYDLVATASQKQCVIHPLNDDLNRLHVKSDDWGYADIFTRMSDIADQTVYLGNTHACRMFLAFKSPMYLHAFADGGYAGADMNNPQDPNADIRWELIEFTYEPEFDKNTGQIWINTTRVDAFQYPMGLELYSKGNVAGSTAYIRRGEIVDYQTVINMWDSAYGNTPYNDCHYNLIQKDDLGGIIKQPSKVESIKQTNIFDPYINRIWDYFSTNTADISMGVLGRWQGRVYGDEFRLTCVEGTYWPVGSTAHIYGKPSTEDAIEGAGQFANGQADDDTQRATDLTVQAMFCAAFNRGQFRTTTANQNWDPDNGIKPFVGGTEFPCNEYVKFFHSTAVTAGTGNTYAFAYDDTFDQSATCYSTAPVAATVTIGGFANGGGSGSNTPEIPDTPDTPTPTDIPAAPTPTHDSQSVKSIFSGAYTTVAPGLIAGSWGQATVASTTQCGGDEAYKLENFNFQGLQISASDATVDVADMEQLHIDIYATAEMEINIHPISLNPTVDSAKATRRLTAGEWNSFDLPLADFAGVDFTRFGQLKLDNGSGQTIYLDNIYFWKQTAGNPGTDPTTPPAAPHPQAAAELVKSLFSDAYTSVTPDIFAGSWGQRTQTSIETCGGDQAYCLTDFDYLGFQLVAADGTISASDMEQLHIDIYATDAIEINIHPISLNPTVDGNMATLNIKAGEWNSFDLPLTDFPDVDFGQLGQIKLEDASRQPRRAPHMAPEAGQSALYLDNIYLWRQAKSVPTSIDGITDDTAGADIFDLHGRLIRRGTSTLGLPAGIYIVGGRKVAVTH